MLIRNLFFFGFVSLCCVFVYFCFLFEFYHKIGHISVFSQVVTLKPIPLLPFGATAIWGQSSKMEQYFLKRGLSFDQNGYLVETNENNKSHKNSTNGDGELIFQQRRAKIDEKCNLLYGFSAKNSIPKLSQFRDSVAFKFILLNEKLKIPYCR